MPLALAPQAGLVLYISTASLCFSSLVLYISIASFLFSTLRILF